MALSKSSKLYIQLTLSVILFLTELVIGYYVRSIALVADAFHMLNDVVSLVIAVYAVKLAGDRKYNPRYSYGLQRAEVLGALINAVLLLGLCLTIVIEAIPRFFEPVAIEQPELILIVGGIGLAFNVFGMFLFGHHHHHHHHHHHGHDDQESHSTHAKKDIESAMVSQNDLVGNSKETGNGGPGRHSHGEGALNIRGVYLHVLGDALASLAVIASALIIWLTSFPQRFLFDPIISIIITLLIIKFTVPLIRSASQILLQGVPHAVPLDEVRCHLLKVDGVLSIHELHLWQLTDTKAVGSMHVVLTTEAYCDFAATAGDIKSLMHRYNVHSVTIQPELSDQSLAETPQPPTSSCLLACAKECVEAQCCPPNAPLPSTKEVHPTTN